MASDTVYVQIDLPKETHKQLKVLSLSRDCTLRSILHEAVQGYIETAPEFRKPQKETKHPREYTANELCETVFYLSRYAKCLEIDKAIIVRDERELFCMIQEWAEGFEKAFDPANMDYLTELESRGPRWLLETFPYTPELEDDPDFDTGMAPPGM